MTANVSKTIIAVALIAFIIYGIIPVFGNIITYILIAAILTLLGQPIMEALSKIKIYKYILPVYVRASLTLLLFLCLFLGFFISFMPLIATQVGNLANIDTQALITAIDQQLSQLNFLMQKYQLSTDDKGLISIIRDSVISVLNMDNITSVFSTFVGFMGNFFIALFSIAFITFFLLVDHKIFYNFFRSFILKDAYKIKFDNVMGTIKELLTRYLVGLLIQILSVGTLVTIGMLLVGNKYALLIGFFAGVINIIPYLGPIIGTTFGMFVVSTTVLLQETPTYLLPVLVKTLLVFLLVQLLDNAFFQPIIFSNSIKAHPLEIFLLVWVGATVIGVSGMILAIPTYTVIRVIAVELIKAFNIELKV